MKRIVAISLIVLGLLLASISTVLAAAPVASPTLISITGPVSQAAAPPMSADLLAAVLGIVLALALSYIPKFGPWFNLQPSETKVQITGVGLVLVAALSFTLACVGWAADLGIGLTCDRPGAIGLLEALVIALLANQATYMLGVKPFDRNNPVG